MLVAEGANVGLFDVIPQEAGASFANGISAEKALYVKVDITDSEAVRAAVAQVVEKFGNLKGAVHCAGIALKREWTNDIAESIPNFKKVSDNRQSPYTHHRFLRARHRYSLAICSITPAGRSLTHADARRQRRRNLHR